MWPFLSLRINLSESDALRGYDHGSMLFRATFFIEEKQGLSPSNARLD